jgi:hypothetical protein
MARITRRLKVYTTRIGIRDWVVAASSQKEALKAWDVRENLFASGAARETQDPTSIEIAMKNPGSPMPLPGNLRMPDEPQRPRAATKRSRDADEDGDEADVIRLDDRRTKKKNSADVIDFEAKRKQRAEGRTPAPQPESRPARGGKSKRKGKADERQASLPLPAPPPPPPPDRSKLDAAEEALEQHETESKERRKELDKKRRALELEIESFESEARRHRERLEKRVERERQAFEEQRRSR